MKYSLYLLGIWAKGDFKVYQNISDILPTSKINNLRIFLSLPVVATKNKSK